MDGKFILPTKQTQTTVITKLFLDMLTDNISSDAQ